MELKEKADEELKQMQRQSVRNTLLIWSVLIGLTVSMMSGLTFLDFLRLVNSVHRGEVIRVGLNSFSYYGSIHSAPLGLLAVINLLVGIPVAAVNLFFCAKNGLSRLDVIIKFALFLNLGALLIPLEACYLLVRLKGIVVVYK